jgi:hypothetical protein
MRWYMTFYVYIFYLSTLSSFSSDRSAASPKIAALQLHNNSIFIKFLEKLAALPITLYKADKKGQREVHFITNLISVETETNFLFKISTSSVKNPLKNLGAKQISAP